MKVGAARRAHLELVNQLPGAQVQQSASLCQTKRACDAYKRVWSPIDLLQVVGLEGIPEEQGFSVAAKAEGVSRVETLVVQPGESQVLQLTWQPSAAGAVRGVLHLAYGDKPTRVQVRASAHTRVCA